MLSDKQMEAWVKLFDGDENRAKKWLSDNAETRNKQIVDSEMIARSQSESEDNPVEELEESEVQDEQIEITDDVIDAIVSRVRSGEGGFDDLADALKVSLAEVAESLATITDAQVALKKSHAEISERLDAIERSEEDKQAAWMEDLSRRTTHRQVVTYRPRNAKKEENSELTMNEQAERTLASIPKY